ncbi:Presequence translocated-associated motor subunit pam17 [Penicillium diatomitis]|uniref:Presequence translocated-associated motor subunit PAM17 n=1 Tax=Penicillium diatomitis TaxID=2819901 RepID=A0A9W9XI94_9EURO|nr:Presequence translocated-associated motor subunit pam17 [Penicillium diatomitis]KAJ5493482.1 Presequence translocated-associated motor subunit pam17 [Penicillium diatomitis]
MSIPSLSASRIGLSMATTLARPNAVARITAQGASAQLTRLNSSLVRASSSIPSQIFQSHNVRPSSRCVARPSERRAQSTKSPNNSEAKLDWDSFFKLRASRRRYSLASSIITSLVSTSVGVQVLAAQDLEALGTQVMGLDPFVVLGLATAACGAVGWLMGPAVGNGVWGLVYRRYKPSVATKEKEFFDRIRRFRVDPSTNSIANPVPDYYGEKIGSVQGYRQWLKDQRAYNRKRRNFIA